MFEKAGALLRGQDRASENIADCGKIFTHVGQHSSSLPATNAKRLRKGALATKQSVLPLLQDDLLRGACHRARMRATRWLAMTAD
jgi:hypothetical protein